jgi:prepilin-type processing-associated H-X9-DG protein
LNYRLPFSFADRQGQTPSAGSFAAFQHYVDLRVSAFGSNHPGGANFCYADGSVSWVADDISHELLQVACTRAAGD